MTDQRAADGNSYRYHATGLPAGGDKPGAAMTQHSSSGNVDSWQWLGGDLPQRCPDWVAEATEPGWSMVTLTVLTGGINVWTARGKQKAHTRDWIVRIDGEIFLFSESAWQLLNRPAQGARDPLLTPKNFLDDVLSACDASNWDADSNQGDYYKGLRDAYEAIHGIAAEYQTSIYAWCKTSTVTSTDEKSPNPGARGHGG